MAMPMMHHGMQQGHNAAPHHGRWPDSRHIAACVAPLCCVCASGAYRRPTARRRPWRMQSPAPFCSRSDANAVQRPFHSHFARAPRRPTRGGGLRVASPSCKLHTGLDARVRTAGHAGVYARTPNSADVQSQRCRLPRAPSYPRRPMPARCPPPSPARPAPRAPRPHQPGVLLFSRAGVCVRADRPAGPLWRDADADPAALGPAGDGHGGYDGGAHAGVGRRLQQRQRRRQPERERGRPPISPRRGPGETAADQRRHAHARANDG